MMEMAKLKKINKKTSSILQKQNVFVSKWLMGTTVFDIGLVLSVKSLSDRRL